jgi:hypothetical protein
MAKFFYPASAGAWLATELDEHGDTCSGLPTLASVFLSSDRSAWPSCRRSASRSD